MEEARRQLDAGDASCPRIVASLAGHTRAWLRRHPTDASLISTAGRLAQRGFVPPHPATLPEGSPEAVWTALTARTPDERAEIAASFVALPQPDEDPAEARRFLALLLLVPGEEERAERLLDGLAPQLDPGELRLRRFQLTAMAVSAEDRAAPSTWEPLLAPLLDHAESCPASASAALRLAASHVLDHADEHGAQWMVPVRGGLRVVNVTLATLRRPALRDELGAVVEWLEQADRLDDHPEPGPVATLLRAVEEADRDGNLAEGSSMLREAFDRTGGREDLRHAIEMRAQLVMDPSVAAGVGVTFDPHAGLAQRSRLELAVPNVTAPDPPASRWDERLDRLAQGGDEDRDALAFLEAVGARERAAAGWLAFGDAQSLLQAWRLRAWLSAADSALLEERLGAMVSDDELVLAEDQEAFGLARALVHHLPEGRARTLLGLRMRAAAPPPAVELAPVSTEPADGYDPHSPSQRLAAAADLLDAGRTEAASAIGAALLRRCEDDGAWSQLFDLVCTMLHDEKVPPALVGATERAIVTKDAMGAALVARLVADSLAAHTVHGSLHRFAHDPRHTAAERLVALKAWLGIWLATDTPPEPASLRELMAGEPALLALAAAGLGSDPDPVTRAHEFLAASPPDKTAPRAFARELLILAQTG